MKQLELHISGMTCNGCVNSVRTILSNHLGVAKDDIDVSLDDARAVIKIGEPLDSESDPLAQALFALQEQGFPSHKVG